MHIRSFRQIYLAALCRGRRQLCLLAFSLGSRSCSCNLICAQKYFVPIPCCSACEVPPDAPRDVRPGDERSAATVSVHLLARGCCELRDGSSECVVLLLVPNCIRRLHQRRIEHVNPSLTALNVASCGDVRGNFGPRQDDLVPRLYRHRQSARSCKCRQSFIIADYRYPPLHSAIRACATAAASSSHMCVGRHRKPQCVILLLEPCPFAPARFEHLVPAVQRLRVCVPWEL